MQKQRILRIRIPELYSSEVLKEAQKREEEEKKEKKTKKLLASIEKQENFVRLETIFSSLKKMNAAKTACLNCISKLPTDMQKQAVSILNAVFEEQTKDEEEN